MRFVKAKDATLLDQAVLAEDVSAKWLAGSAMFGDLLELERYLGEIAFMTLLFVESPGSYAELGAFSIISPLKNNLMIVVDREHGGGESFIANGPVRSVERQSAGSVLRHSLPQTHGCNARDPLHVDDAESILEEVRDYLAQGGADAVARDSDRRRQMLLAAGLVQSFGIVKLSEIHSVLQCLDDGLSLSELRRLLFVLDALKIIRRWEYSKELFYVTRLQETIVSWRFLIGARMRDTAEWQERFVNENLSDRRSRRAKAFRRWSEEMSQA